MWLNSSANNASLMTWQIKDNNIAKCFWKIQSPNIDPAYFLSVNFCAEVSV